MGRYLLLRDGVPPHAAPSLFGNSFSRFWVVPPIENFLNKESGATFFVLVKIVHFLGISLYWICPKFAYYGYKLTEEA